MPSATLNNSDPGNAIGQAGKSHSPASFKIKGQGGIKEKDNTSLKQRLHSVVPISQVPTRFCCRERAGARVLWGCQGTAPQCPPQCPPQDLENSATCLGDTAPPAHLARKCQFCSRHWPALTSQATSMRLPQCTSTSPVARGHNPIRAFIWSRSLLRSRRFSPLPAPFPNFSHISLVPRTGLDTWISKETSEHECPSLPGPYRARSKGWAKDTSTTFRPLYWVCLIERSFLFTFHGAWNVLCS